MTSPGDTQIASIGVLLVFRLWVAGGEAGECWVRMASESPREVNLLASQLDRTSALLLMPITMLSPVSKEVVIAERRSASKTEQGSRVVVPWSWRYRRCWL